MVPVKILYIRPVADSDQAAGMEAVLRRAAREGTVITVRSLPEDRPRHLEYHAYEAVAVKDIVEIVRASGNGHDGIVLGGFYDMGLRAAREVSGRAIVTAPCESSTAIARALGQRFSILVGRRKWIPKMTDLVRGYGHGDAMASMRAIGLGVEAIRAEPELAHARLRDEARRAIEEDGAEVLILGCTAKYGFHEELTKELGAPVIDSMIAALRYAEMLAGTWSPSRLGGSEPPPEDEIRSWGLFES